MIHRSVLGDLTKRQTKRKKKHFLHVVTHKGRSANAGERSQCPKKNSGRPFESGWRWFETLAHDCRDFLERAAFLSFLNLTFDFGLNCPFKFSRNMPPHVNAQQKSNNKIKLFIVKS